LWRQVAMIVKGVEETDHYGPTYDGVKHDAYDRVVSSTIGQ
jgi:hypothetical protein